MKTIGVIGAGKSSPVLIRRLQADAGEGDWRIVIGEQDRVRALVNVEDSERTEVRTVDVNDADGLKEFVSNADLVISMVPAFLHLNVAKACLNQGTDLITASYVTDELRELDGPARDKGVLLLNEMGVDPGIDHMSAMSVLDRIRSEGGTITAFESFTGGLLAPESEKDNPWKYKFTWNPRNVVLAGQGTVKFIQEGKYKYIPYQRLFRRTEIIHIEDYGHFEGYANRDSLQYREAYNLEGAKTIFRGTLRRPGFSRAWNAFVQLGATDDSYTIEDSEELTYREFINSFLYYNPNDSVELKLAHYLRWDMDSEEMYRMRWLGLFEDKKVGLKNATPAQILQKILEDKWTMNEDDKDMLVMWHKFNFTKDGKDKELQSSMVALGSDQRETAMAKTVGYPLAIAAKLILQDQIKLKGVVIPTARGIYEPVLRELDVAGISFREIDM